MRLRLLAVISIAFLLFAPGGTAVGDSSADNAAGTTSAESGQAKSSGVVKKVDKGAGKVTIRHEPLENLGMPKMTMVFRVKDPSMLDRLKEGDKIRFVAEKVDGVFTVMSFEPMK
jgi:Cu/Ag efflux protein CusF